MNEISKDMFIVLDVVNEIVKKNPPKNIVESLTIKELIGKIADSDADEAIFELMNMGLLLSEVEPVGFDNGLQYRPLTGISAKGKELLNNHNKK